MSREIKFRAWNIVSNVMIDLKKVTPFALNINTDGLFIPFSDDFLLMQFTGLKDKNGKDIYEGDIIKLPTFTSAVSFDDACFRLTHNDSKYRLGGFKQSGEMEIIGNIYE